MQEAEEKLLKLTNLEELGLVKKYSKVYYGIKYDILVYRDRISWKVADNRFINWNNHARLWNGELEFDFNTFGLKGLGQQWTKETFEIFGDNIKSIKAVWNENPFYPKGQSLGHKQFWDDYFVHGDKIKAVKKTNFYSTMSKKGFSNVVTIIDDYNETIVILTK